MVEGELEKSSSNRAKVDEFEFVELDIRPVKNSTSFSSTENSCPSVKCFHSFSPDQGAGFEPVNLALLPGGQLPGRKKVPVRRKLLEEVRVERELVVVAPRRRLVAGFEPVSILKESHFEP